MSIEDDMRPATLLPKAALRPPKELSPLARCEWRRLIVELPNLPATDRGTLAQYCACFARWQEAEARIIKEGTLIKTKSGNVIQHPSVGVSNTAAKLCRAFAIELGITPKARGERATKRTRKKLPWEIVSENDDEPLPPDERWRMLPASPSPQPESPIASATPTPPPPPSPAPTTTSNPAPTASPPASAPAPRKELLPLVIFPRG